MSLIIVLRIVNVKTGILFLNFVHFIGAYTSHDQISNYSQVGRLHAMNMHESELDPRENDTIDFIPHDEPLKVRILT